MLIPTFNGEARDAKILDHATEVVFVIGRINFPFPEARAARPVAPEPRPGFDVRPVQNVGEPQSENRHDAVSYVRRDALQATDQGQG